MGPNYEEGQDTDAKNKLEIKRIKYLSGKRGIDR